MILCGLVRGLFPYSIDPSHGALRGIPSSPEIFLQSGILDKRDSMNDHSMRTSWDYRLPQAIPPVTGDHLQNSGGAVRAIPECDEETLQPQENPSPPAELPGGGSRESFSLLPASSVFGGQLFFPWSAVVAFGESYGGCFPGEYI